VRAAGSFLGSGPHHRAGVRSVGSGGQLMGAPSLVSFVWGVPLGMWRRTLLMGSLWSTAQLARSARYCGWRCRSRSELFFPMGPRALRSLGLHSQPGWRNGRRGGLKPLWPSRAVRVRPPSWAHSELRNVFHSVRPGDQERSLRAAVGNAPAADMNVSVAIAHAINPDADWNQVRTDSAEIGYLRS
jgi:hypothetical protein